MCLWKPTPAMSGDEVVRPQTVEGLSPFAVTGEHLSGFWKGKFLFMCPGPLPAQVVCLYKPAPDLVANHAGVGCRRSVRVARSNLIRNM